MNKKLFALIIASSIIALPITAQESENNTQDTAVTKAEERGFKNGIAATLAASTIAMILYIKNTLKEGLFIPAGINCRSVPSGLTWIPVQHCAGGACHTSSTPMQNYQLVCDENPLFKAMRDVSGEISIQGASINKDPSLKDMIEGAQTQHATSILLERFKDTPSMLKDAPSINSVSLHVNENMIEKIGNFPNKLAYACAATLIGTFVYYLSLKYKPQKSANTDKPNSLEQPSSVAL